MKVIVTNNGFLDIKDLNCDNEVEKLFTDPSKCPMTFIINKMFYDLLLFDDESSESLN